MDSQNNYPPRLSRDKTPIHPPRRPLRHQDPRLRALHSSKRTTTPTPSTLPPRIHALSLLSMDSQNNYPPRLSRTKTPIHPPRRPLRHQDPRLSALHPSKRTNTPTPSTMPARIHSLCRPRRWTLKTIIHRTFQAPRHPSTHPGVLSDTKTRD